MRRYCFLALDCSSIKGAQRGCASLRQPRCAWLNIIMMLALTVSDDNVIVLSLRNGTRALPY